MDGAFETTMTLDRIVPKMDGMKPLKDVDIFCVLGSKYRTIEINRRQCC